MKHNVSLLIYDGELMGADKLDNFTDATDNIYNHQPRNQVVSEETACVCVCVCSILHSGQSRSLLMADLES